MVQLVNNLKLRLWSLKLHLLQSRSVVCQPDKIFLIGVDCLQLTVQPETFQYTLSLVQPPWLCICTSPAGINGHSSCTSQPSYSPFWHLIQDSRATIAAWESFKLWSCSSCRTDAISSRYFERTLKLLYQ